MKKNYRVEYKYYGFIVLIIFIISLFLFRKYLFEGYYLFNDSMMSDVIRASVPAYYHVFDAMQEGGWVWSWQMGIGTSMFSHADTFFDPFMYIVFLFGKSHILQMLIWMFIAKIICEGLAFYSYINYFKVDKKAAICASIIYAFSGFSMIIGINFVMGTILVYLPLILLGAEKYMQEGKKGLLFLILFLTCIMSYYYFYISAIGLAFYVIYRMIYRNDVSWKKLFGFLAVGILAVGSSMFILLPQIELVLQSPRVTGKHDIAASLSLFIPAIKTLFTALIRSISNDALGNTYTVPYMGEVYSVGDYFQESTFAGTLFFYFVAIAFKEEDKNRRKKYIGIGILIALCILLPFVSYVSNACSTINARWMYWITLIQCVVIALAITKMIQKAWLDWELYCYSFVCSMCILFVGIIILSAGDNFAYKLSALCNALVGRLGWIIMVYISIPLVCWIISKIYNLLGNRIIIKERNVLFIAMMFILGCDILSNYYWWYESDYSVTEYSEENIMSYEDKSALLISELLPSSEEFYRINKSFDAVVASGIPSENDAMIQGYYGLKNYNSLGNASYISFLQKAGCYCTVPFQIQSYIDRGLMPTDLVGQDLNYVNGVEDRYNLMSYLGVKYYLSKTEGEKVPPYFKLIFSDAGIYVYENAYNMPLIFCNNMLMSENTFATLSNDEKDRVLLSCTILQNTDESEIKIPSLEEALYGGGVQEKQTRFKMISFSNDDIVCEVDVPAGNHYASTTIPYDSNWEIYVDGKLVETKKVNIGFVGFSASEGKHIIELKYHLKSFYFGSKISIIFLAITLFVFGVNKITKRKNKVLQG